MMTDSIIIRKASVADVKKLSILFKQVYIQTYGKEGVSDEFANFITLQFSEARIEDSITQHPDNMMVAEYRNNLVGVAEISLDKLCPIDWVSAPELNKLYLLEWFCGKNIGAMLLNEIEKNLREAGYKEIWLWVLHTNHRAIHFYEKSGYVAIGGASFQMEVNSYYNIVMLKNVTTPENTFS